MNFNPQVLVAVLTYLSGSVVACFLWTYEMQLWQFLVGYFALLTMVPVAFAPNQALFSKQVEGSRHQAFLVSLLSVVDSCGAILGPIWMGVATESEQGDNRSDDGNDDDGDGQDDTLPSSGPVARLLFYGNISLALLLAVLVMVTWFGYYPPRFASTEARQGTKQGASRDEEGEGDGEGV